MNEDNMQDSLLPYNLQDESSLALESIIKQAFKVDLKTFMTAFVDYLSDDILPHLAESCHIMGDEGWNLCNTREEKIALIKKSTNLHRKKGTVGAVKEILNLFDFPVSYKSWTEYDGIPHHYKVDVDLIERGLDSELYDFIERKLNQVKQLRAKLDGIYFYLAVEDSIKVNNALCVGESITVDFRDESEIERYKLVFECEPKEANVEILQPSDIDTTDKTLEVKPYTTVDYRVSLEGYETKNGSVTIAKDTVYYIVLNKEEL